MENRTIKIHEISKINAESIGSKNVPQIIHYLDTSSITRNRIENIQILDSNVSPFPSRAQRKVKCGTIVYSTVRPEQEHFGFIEKNSEHLIVSTGFLTIDVIDEGIDPKYLYYLLTRKDITKHLQTIATNNVSSYPSINPSDLGNLEFVIPKDKSEQQKIAAVLSALDAKIELNARINAELEAMANTLYDYWFVQFDFPDADGKPYKASGGAMVWNDALKRAIPAGWEVGKLDDNIELIIDHRGKTPKKLGGDWLQEGDGIIALSARIVKGGKLLNLDQANKVSFEMFNKWMPEKLQNGDILMTSEAPLGEFYYILGKTDYCLSQRLFAIRSDKTKVLSSYLYYELSKGNGYSQIIGSQSGSTVFGIRQDELRKIIILKPDITIQNDFDKIVIPFIQIIRNNDSQNQTLAALRDWLLPLLMNGQASVR